MELKDNINNSNLCIITDCVHFSINGKIGSNNAILIKQFNELFKYFNRVTICCPLSKQESSNRVEFYQNKKVKFFFVKTLGGPKIIDKFQLLVNIPNILLKIHKASKNSNYIYQRFPNNINIPGFFYTLFSSKDYLLVTWENGMAIEVHYHIFSKSLLKYIYKGPVFIYNFSDNKKLIETFSPSFSINDWKLKHEKIKIKIFESQKWKKSHEIVFLNVGRVDENKNQIESIKIIKKLKESGYSPLLYIIGDLISPSSIIEYINQEKLQKNVLIIGRVSFDHLQTYYEKAKFILQTPLYEGYGKVPIEGMVSGCIPLIKDVGVSKKIIEKSRTGILLSNDLAMNVDKIISLLNDSKTNRKMILNGRSYSKKLTIELWAKSIHTSIKNYYENENHKA